MYFFIAVMFYSSSYEILHNYMNVGTCSKIYDMCPLSSYCASDGKNLMSHSYFVCWDNILK